MRDKNLIFGHGIFSKIGIPKSVQEVGGQFRLVPSHNFIPKISHFYTGNTGGFREESASKKGNLVKVTFSVDSTAAV